jgi:HEAT repeat protein
VRQAAARALGKLRDKKAVEPLIGNLKDPDLYVRAFSAWALGEIQDPRALEPLCGSLSDKEEKVKERSFEALRNYSDPAAKRMMVNTLINNARIRPSYEWMLPRLINLEGKEVILKALEDPGGDRAQTIGNYIDLMETNIYNVSDIATQALVDYPDRGVVISGLSNYIGYQAGTGRITRSIILLGRLKDRRGLPVLLDTLDKKKGSYDRVTVIDAIGEIGDKGTVELLLKIFVDEKEPLGPRMAAARALGKLGDPRAVEPLLRVARDEGGNKEIRKDAAYALGLLGDKRAVDPLINILKNKKEDGWLRVAAAASLGNIGDERAIGPLQETQEDSYVQNAAQSALKKIRAK